VADPEGICTADKVGGVQKKKKKKKKVGGIQK
jgi:hypothetical protein